MGVYIVAIDNTALPEARVDLVCACGKHPLQTGAVAKSTCHQHNCDSISTPRKARHNGRAKFDLLPNEIYSREEADRIDSSI